jgi:hypothetical protein
MSFEGGVAKINFGKLRGRKMPPYTVVRVLVASPRIKQRLTFLTCAGNRQRPQMWEQSLDGGNFPRSCELVESPTTAVPLYYDKDKVLDK